MDVQKDMRRVLESIAGKTTLLNEAGGANLEDLIKSIKRLELVTAVKLDALEGIGPDGEREDEDEVGRSPGVGGYELAARRGDLERARTKHLKLLKTLIGAAEAADDTVLAKKLHNLYDMLPKYHSTAPRDVRNQIKAALDDLARPKGVKTEAMSSSRVIARYQKIQDHLNEKKDDIGLALLNDMMDALGL